MTRDEILRRIVAALVDMLDVDGSTVRIDSRLVEDLELDSIDAVDLAATAAEITGKRVGEKELRALRTVGDVVLLVERDLSGK